MALVVFGEKIDILSIPNPEPGGFIVAYDLDGILKQKDIQRQQNIEKILNCKIIRIKQNGLSR